VPGGAGLDDTLRLHDSLDISALQKVGRLG
jgi:hypothetical protein